MKKNPISLYLFFAFLGVMFFLNVIMLMGGIFHIIPSVCMLGDNADSLGFYNFWADILGSIASFTMIFITAKTLEHSKKQLDELNRQWNEEHSPYVTCELLPSTETADLRLHIFNSSNVIAENIRIDIVDKLEYSNYSDGLICPELDKENINEIFKFIREQIFALPPKRGIYFYLNIPGPELATINGYLEVVIEIHGISKRMFKLYPSNFKYFSV